MINKEKFKQYQRNWYLENKERIKEYHKNWCLVNQDKVKASNIRSCRKYYKKNKLKIAKMHQQNHKKTRDQRLAYMKKYYVNNKKTALARNKLNYQKNKERYLKNSKAYQKKWEKRNRDHLNKQNLKKAEKLAKPLNLKAYDYKNYLQSWSELVRKRDKNKCQVCGNKAKVSHHLLFKSAFPHLSFNLNNGLAMCDPCHYELHRLNN